MQTNTPTWKQIRAVTRLIRRFGLDTLPGVQDALDVHPEEPHFERAAEEIRSWRRQPTNPEGMVPAIARWFAIGDGLMSIGVGQAEGTGVQEAMDYWGRVRNRADLTDGHKARRLAERLGLPDEPVAFVAAPPVPSTAAVKSAPDMDRLVQLATALRQAGYSPEEVARSLIDAQRG